MTKLGRFNYRQIIEDKCPNEVPRKNADLPKSLKVKKISAFILTASITSTVLSLVTFVRQWGCYYNILLTCTHSLKLLLL